MFRVYLQEMKERSLSWVEIKEILNSHIISHIKEHCVESRNECLAAAPSESLQSSGVVKSSSITASEVKIDHLWGVHFQTEMYSTKTTRKSVSMYELSMYI